LDAVIVRGLSGQKRGAAWRAERQVHEAVLEGYAVIGDERQRLRHIGHRAGVLLIVGHDDDDIGGAGGGRGSRGTCHRSKQKEECTEEPHGVGGNALHDATGNRRGSVSILRQPSPFLTFSTRRSSKYSSRTATRS